MSRLTLIVAATKSNGIGLNGGLPWRLPKEMAYFAKATTHAPEGSTNRVIMGRNTWDSIPAKFRPLPNRHNTVLSRSSSFTVEGATAEIASSLNAALGSPSSTHIHRTFIIGGSTLYNESLALEASATAPFVDRILMTRVLDPAYEECDVHFPDFAADSEWKRTSHEDLEGWLGFEVPQGIQEEKGVKYEFQMWVR